MKACSAHVEISIAVSVMLRRAYTESCGHPGVMWIVNLISRAVSTQQSRVSLAAFVSHEIVQYLCQCRPVFDLLLKMYDTLTSFVR